MGKSLFYVGIASAMVEYQGIIASIEVLGILQLLADVAYIAVFPLCHCFTGPEIFLSCCSCTACHALFLIWQEK
jgi:hypothetical protein